MRNMYYTAIEFVGFLFLLLLIGIFNVGCVINSQRAGGRETPEQKW